RDLPPDIAHLRAQVPAMHIDEPLPRQGTQPDVERYGRGGRVLGESPAHLQVSVLEDVRRVDATGQAAIEAKPDHLAQTVAVAGEQHGQSLLIPLIRPSQEVGLIGRGCGHDGPLKIYSAQRSCARTGKKVAGLVISDRLSIPGR